MIWLIAGIAVLLYFILSSVNDVLAEVKDLRSELATHSQQNKAYRDNLEALLERLIDRHPDPNPPNNHNPFA